MESQPPIIKVFIDNEKKVLEAGKYNKAQFDWLIDSLEKAERTRIQILKLIKDQGQINVDKIKKELGLSDEIIELNIEYLRELGLLGFLNEYPRFFREIIENSDHPGLFPSTKIIKEKNLCCGCGLCVAICPVNAIDYLEGTFEINEDLCIHCGLCYSACPRSFFPIFSDNRGFTDPEAKFNEQFKSYRMLCTAQTTEERIKQVAQDGGIVTTLLKTAFKEGYIDGTFAVTLGDQPLKPLPIFVKNQEELLKTAGTKYTNVP